MNIYTLYKDGKEVFTGTNKEVCLLLGISIFTSLAQCAKLGNKIKGFEVKITGEKEKYKIYSVLDLDGKRVMTSTANKISKRLKIAHASVAPAAKSKKLISDKFYIINTEDDSLNINELKALSVLNSVNRSNYIEEPYEFKGTKMIRHLNYRGELIHTTFLPL